MQFLDYLKKKKNILRKIGFYLNFIVIFFLTSSYAFAKTESNFSTKILNSKLIIFVFVFFTYFYLKKANFNL